MWERKRSESCHTMNTCMSAVGDIERTVREVAAILIVTPQQFIEAFFAFRVSGDKD